MSLCPMSPKSIRRLNREYGTEAINAAAHHSHDVFCVGVGGSVFWIDRRTGRVELDPAAASSYRRDKFAGRPIWWVEK